LTCWVAASGWGRWPWRRWWYLQDTPEENYPVVLCPRLPFCFNYDQDDSHHAGRRWNNGFNDLARAYLGPAPLNDGTLLQAGQGTILGVQAGRSGLPVVRRDSKSTTLGLHDLSRPGRLGRSGLDSCGGQRRAQLYGADPPCSRATSTGVTFPISIRSSLPKHRRLPGRPSEPRPCTRIDRVDNELKVDNLAACDHKLHGSAPGYWRACFAVRQARFQSQTRSRHGLRAFGRRATACPTT